MTEEELLHTLALRRLAGVGDITARKLIAKFGSAIQIYDKVKKKSPEVDAINPTIIREIQSTSYLSQASEEVDFMKREGVSHVYFLEENYPVWLAHCVDSPILLFFKGKINFEQKRTLSIVGTRNMTPYGGRFLESFMEQIQAYKPIIVSGFAYGVDITAHKLAMKYNLETVACLAHGFDSIYPSHHAKYVPDMLSKGGFVTDFWSGDKLHERNFVSRNRIIAGFSEATLVVESGLKGGGLITANMAHSYDRTVMTLPGGVYDLYSMGCNKLIRDKKAELITSCEDLVDLLAWDLSGSDTEPQNLPFVEMTSEEQKIADYLTDKNAVLLDTISRDCQIPPHRSASLLLEMELKGIVRPLPGKLFELL